MKTPKKNRILNEAEEIRVRKMLNKMIDQHFLFFQISKTTSSKKIKVQAEKISVK